MHRLVDEATRTNREAKVEVVAPNRYGARSKRAIL
jgi:hypothetical protein